MELSVCELFAGVGGFRLGLERSGPWQTVFMNQWEPSRIKQYAFKCYQNHFKSGIQSNQDISTVPASSIPNHTLLTGGFPCQDYSVATTAAKGIVGKKGVLWWEIERIVREKNTPFLLLENVDRLLKSPTSQRGRDFGIILACLNNLNYSVEWRVVNAADYSFPQKRRRIFLFAFKNSTNYYCSTIVWPLEKYLEAGAFFGSIFPVVEFPYRKVERQYSLLPTEISEVLDTFSFPFEKSGFMTQGLVYTRRVKAVTSDVCPLHSILENSVEEKYYIPDSEINKWSYMKGPKKELVHTRKGVEFTYEEGPIPFPDFLDCPGRTMVTSESSTNRCAHVIADPRTQRFRFLTPVECERMNGFNDNWTDTGMPERFRYFCMGNALVVGVVEKMGRKLVDIVGKEI